MGGLPSGCSKQACLHLRMERFVSAVFQESEIHYEAGLLIGKAPSGAGRRSVGSGELVKSINEFHCRTAIG